MQAPHQERTRTLTCESAGTVIQDPVAGLGARTPEEPATRAQDDAVPAISKPSPGPRLLWRRSATVLAPIAAYFVIAYLCYFPAAPWSGTTVPGGLGGDTSQGIWFVAWNAYAIVHGLNPFYTTVLVAPHGANLAIDNTSPLLGLLVAPVTWLAGPVAAYNLLFRLGLGLTGVATYFVLRRYTRWWPAAFLGGLFFEVGPFEMAHARAHVFLVFLPLVPVLWLLLDEWLVSCRRRPVEAGLLVGVVVGMQYLISIEVLACCTLFAAFAFACMAITHRREVRRRIALLGRGLPPALGAFFVLAGYPLWMLLAGPNRPSRGFHNLSNLAFFHGDLLAPLLPTKYLAIHFGTTAGQLVGQNPGENGFYLGVPLILLLAYLVVRFRRTGIVALSAAIGLAAFVLSLGSSLTFDNKKLFSPMPAVLLAHLPLLKNIETARLSLFIQLAAAFVLAAGVDALHRVGWRWRDLPRDRLAEAPRLLRRKQWAALLGVAPVLIAIAPVVPRPVPPGKLRLPEFFRTPADYDKIPVGATVLTFPYPRTPHEDPMVWQAHTGIRFRIVGGEATVPGPGGAPISHEVPAAPAPLQRLLLSGAKSDGRWDSSPPHGRNLQPMLRALCLRVGINVILIDNRRLNSRKLATVVDGALGERPLVFGNMSLWLDVQAHARAMDQG